MEEDHNLDFQCQKKTSWKILKTTNLLNFGKLVHFKNSLYNDKTVIKVGNIMSLLGVCFLRN